MGAKVRAQPNSHSFIQSLAQSLSQQILIEHLLLHTRHQLRDGVTNKMRSLSQVTPSLAGDDSLGGKKIAIQWGQ